MKWIKEENKRGCACQECDAVGKEIVKITLNKEENTVFFMCEECTLKLADMLAEVKEGQNHAE